LAKQNKGEAKVSVIMLTFNSVSKLGGFFDRVLAGLSNIQYDKNICIIFVDNNSCDDTVSHLNRWIKGKSFMHNARILQLDRNYGWAGGNNRGALICKDADYLVFLNDDVIVKPDTITKLVNCLESDSSIGAAQPLIINADGSINCGFDLGLGGFACPKMLRRFQRVSNTIDIFYAMGSALITRADLFFKLGMFDEDYFYWYDDVDYCWRVRLAGYRVVCLPDAEVYHYGSATLGRSNPVLNYYWVRNNLYFCSKNYTLKYLILTTPIRLGEILVGGLGHNLLSKDILGIKHLARGFIDGVKGLSLFLSKRSWLRKSRSKVEIAKLFNPYVDVEMLLGWLSRGLNRLEGED